MQQKTCSVQNWGCRSLNVDVGYRFAWCDAMEGLFGAELDAERRGSGSFMVCLTMPITVSLNPWYWGNECTISIALATTYSYWIVKRWNHSSQSLKHSSLSFCSIKVNQGAIRTNNVCSRGLRGTITPLKQSKILQDTVFYCSWFATRAALSDNISLSSWRPYSCRRLRFRYW